MNMKKKDDIWARLTIHNIATMTPREYRIFKEWIKKTSKELTTEKDLKIFAKRYRATLYK